MKKLSVIIATVLAGTIAFAQNDVQSAAAQAAAAILDAPKQEAPVEKPKYWASSSAFSLGFLQTGLTNWAAGGYNNMTFSVGIDAKANYAKEMTSWNNRLQLDYAFFWSADKENLLQKSKDRIYFESAFGYKTEKDSKWSYSASFNFRSQFTDSYDKYVQDPDTKKWQGTLKSGFVSPAYTDISLGMQWKPGDWFDMEISPLTGSITTCYIPELRKNYGMKLKDESITSPVGSDYNSFLFQFGAKVKMNAKATINDVLGLETQLVVFTDYLSHPFKHNRVNWDNKISWQPAKLFKIEFSTWLIYDPLVLIDGTQRVQFKEYLDVKFTYTISNKKK